MELLKVYKGSIQPMCRKQTVMERPSCDGAAHVLIIPYPAQGHVSSLLKFAELLSLTAPDFHITFVNTEHSHRLLLRHAALFAGYPRFRFKTIPDGLPDDHPRSSGGICGGWDLFWSFLETGGPQLRELIVSSHNPGGGDENAPPPITCVIADGTMVFPIDVGKEVGVPVISFNTLPASCLWTQFCIPQIIKSAELPTKASDMEKLITSIPSMEGMIRGRDLPSFFRVDDSEDSSLQFMWKQVSRALEAHALIINTFEDLEAPVLFQIRSQFPRTVHTIGPIAAHLEAKLMKPKKSSPISTSLREEDKSCMPWLDLQAPKSVIYVSFGSTTTMSEDELMEIYHGLINSECKFLWVIRSDMIKQDGTSQSIPEEVTNGMKERGFIVGWAPQEEVLAHPAVGAFFTHSGWNSTLESIVAGKPMICWPFFADQQMNSRFVSEVWKLGLDMKDNISREIVERLVRDVMIQRRDDFAGSAMEMAELVRQCVSSAGSSHRALNDLICDIRLISSKCGRA